MQFNEMSYYLLLFYENNIILSLAHILYQGTMI